MGILISNESSTDRNIRHIQKFAFICLIILVFVLFVFGCIFGANVMPVDSNDNNTYTFVVNQGESKEQGLIKNEFFAKLYLKTNEKLQFYAGTYNLKKSMSLPEIYDSIGNTKKALTDDVKVKFVEGKRFTDYAKVIAENFDNITYDDVINKGKDKE